MSLLNAHGFDFLMGCLFGSIVIPWLVRLVTNDGWRFAPKNKPRAGDEVLIYDPRDGVFVATYTGPDGGGEVPENAKVYWRPLPRLPFVAGHDMER